jgi:hypothetical protein
MGALSLQSNRLIDVVPGSYASVPPINAISQFMVEEEGLR